MALTADTIFETAIGIEGSDKNIYRYLRRLDGAGLTTLKPESLDAVYPFPEYECEGLLKTIDTIAHVTGQFPTAPLLSLHWPINDLRPSVRKAKHDRHAIIQTYIDRALERWRTVGPPKKPRWAIDLIITREQSAAKKAGREPDYSSKMFHDALFGYCFGGQDTTHSALSFLVKHFGMYQEPQRKLRAALREGHATAVLEHRCPTSDEICRAGIPYLDAYIEEVLRLNTTASAVIKEVIEDIEVLGYHIPKGTQLFVPLWGASINSPALPIDESKRSKSSQEHINDVPTDWSDCGYPPETFHPERWMRENPETGKIVFNPRAGPHMTFSVGARECWGRRLAMITLRLVTTLMIWNFEFLPLPEGMDSLDVTDILNAKPSVCLIRLKPLDI
jgi:cytochrome P450